jgi:RNA polymerase-binding transcription factor DksA
MSQFEPATALQALVSEYQQRAEAIRRDLQRSHSPDFAEQAAQRQNDEVLEALLAEAEAGLLAARRAQVRLDDGNYGQCLKCGEAIQPQRLRALPAVELCVACTDA